jgi:hypothetical protein
VSVRRALLAVPLAAVALLVAPAAPAVALSCVPPGTLLAHAERAFIGTLLARDGDRMTFDLAEAFGGELPDPLVVRDDLPLPWRVSAPPDTEIGLVVYERNGELLVNPCTVVPPASLREALPPGTVHPTPRPTASRPRRLSRFSDPCSRASPRRTRRRRCAPAATAVVPGP